MTALPRRLALSAAACLALAAGGGTALAQQAPMPSGGAVSQPPASQAPAPSPTGTAPSPAQDPEPSGPPTGAGTSPAAQPGLQPGARGASVKSLQRALRRKHIMVPLTARYDARTRAGVRILQRRLRLKATGVADGSLLQRLGVTVRSIAAPATDPGTPFKEYPVPEPDDQTPSKAGFIWPANGVVSSPFGPRWGRMHEGLDIAAPEGRPIRAAKAGTVITAGPESGYGNLVVIDHGNGVTTRYGHMSAFEVKQGDVVAIGQVIGRVGSTGHSTGSHVHFEIRINGVATDPAPYL